MIFRVIGAAVVLGTVLNIAGWVGNAIVLRDLWESAATIAPPGKPIEPRWLRDALSLVSDYVFAVVLCATYAVSAPGWRGPKTALALILAVLVWLAAVPMTYLAFVSAGYLPIEVSVATSVWALATFAVFAPALPYLLPPNDLPRTR
jgi:hypothetical protein